MAVLGAAVIGLGAVYVLRKDAENDQLSLRDLMANSDPGPIHVHGLGVNPADRSLFIAKYMGAHLSAR